MEKEKSNLSKNSDEVAWINLKNFKLGVFYSVNQKSTHTNTSKITEMELFVFYSNFTRKDIERFEIYSNGAPYGEK